jgi:NADPH:quinone reductase-like Zn-dependent oxidoreductase
MLAGWYEKGGVAEKVIEVGDMEIPRARPGEVLVRLRASSISPSDYKKRAPNADTARALREPFGLPAERQPESRSRCLHPWVARRTESGL